MDTATGTTVVWYTRRHGRRLLAVQQRFMVKHGYLSAGVDIRTWEQPAFLAEACAREGLAPPRAA